MKLFKILILLLLSGSFLGCEKFLNAKPDATLATPASLEDLQALLDNYAINTQFPGCTEIMTDNYYLTDADWNSISKTYQKDYYVWKPTDQNNLEWNTSYKHIYTCNLVLENLVTINYKKSEIQKANKIKGNALFIRASYFYSLAQLFAKGYNKNTASTDLGIPIKLTTDITSPTVRSSIKDSYERIIEDFKEASLYVPLIPSIKTHASIAACYGALARVYLVMQDYQNALKYADSCLALYSYLIDYNSVDIGARIPFARFNDEVIFQATSYSSINPLSPRICKIDTILYDSYSSDDLRKQLFFKDNGNGSYAFKGDYDGTSNNGNGHLFTGIATDEQYLIKAECYARLGKIQESLNALNSLLVKRWKSNTYVNLELEDTTVLINTILKERRKELLFRGTRLPDIRRLNLEQDRQVTLRRSISGIIYELPPNDARYVSLIPDNVIEMTGILQNP
jgi:tetratricopeptide (TPR) repeat protein